MGIGMERYIAKDKAFYRVVLTLALPVVAQNMINIGVNIMDTYMLGKYGEVQLSGSSLANDFIMIFQILCMGMGGGAAVLTAQFWGKQDITSLKRAVAIMLRLSLAIALLFTVVTAAFPAQIMSLYTVDAAVIEKGRLYFLMSLPTYLLMGLSLTLTLILRSVRNVVVPLVTSAICFVVNIFFNWVFIFGNLGAPEMQIEGAALGTLIARAVEAIMISVYVLAAEKRIGFRVRDLFRSCRDLLRSYMRYSIPVLLSDAMLAFGNTAVSMVIGHVGTGFVAANAIIAPIVRLSTVFTQGLGQASSIMTGNALGAGKRDTAYRQGVTFFILSILIGVFAAVIILLFTPFMIRHYNITQSTAGIARHLMFAVAIMVVFQSTQSVLTKGVLRGGGDTLFLMIADVLFLWIVSLPLGAAAGLLWHMDPFYVYLLLKIDWAIKTFICAYRLKSKKWIRIV